MLSQETIKGLAKRQEKAEALVAEGAVFPVAGLPKYAVVKNGDGTQMYLVRYEEGHECCSCPDFRERQRELGLPCKHLMAARIAASSAPTGEAALGEHAGDAEVERTMAEGLSAPTA